MVRKAYRAGSFYPASAGQCRSLIAECMRPWKDQLVSPPPRIGIVPHAGWVFSGPTAGAVFEAMLKGSPEIFLVLGAIHVPGVRKAALYPAGQWETPLGPISIDEELNSRILDSLKGRAEENANAHKFEHSIEVQVPFIRHLFPKSRLVALMVPPDENAAALGRALGAVLEDRPDVNVLGSTDLTHYGLDNFGFAPAGIGPKALEWVRNVNDRAMIDAMLNLDAEATVAQSRRNYNACGAGAIAAAVACARALGSTQGRLLHYTTSYDVMPQRQATDFVGYAAVVF